MPNTAESAISGAIENPDRIHQIGGYNYGTGSASFFYGTIDEVRIYNRALTATEVENHYKSGRDSSVF